MENENEVQDPVVATSDSGDGLVNEVSNESNENNTADEPAEFDPAAFSRTEEAVVDNNETETSNENDNSNDSNDSDTANSDDDDDIVWPDLHTSDDNKDSESEQAGEEITNNEEKGEELNSENTEAVELSDDQFKQFAEKLGLVDANNLEEIKSSLDGIVEENKKLKEQVEESKYSGNTNKKIDDLENFLKLDDEKLMRESLKADGLSGDKLENVIEKYTDTGLLEIEALKIRNTLDRTIQSERKSIVNSQEADVAKQQESRKESVESFTEFMQSQESVFDMKLTGDSDKLPEVRKDHTKYVTSGDYLSEITSNEKNLFESSWLWRHREVLQKAFSNNGRQNGRVEILNKIGNPDKTSRTTLSEPGNPKEFDPSKFMAG